MHNWLSTSEKDENEAASGKIKTDSGVSFSLDADKSSKQKTNEGIVNFGSTNMNMRKTDTFGREADDYSSEESSADIAGAFGALSESGSSPGISAAFGNDSFRKRREVDVLNQGFGEMHSEFRNPDYVSTSQSREELDDSLKLSSQVTQTHQDSHSRIYDEDDSHLKVKSAY